MRNLIEQEEYQKLFFEHPPSGIDVDPPMDGLPSFRMDFDLLTTFDPKMARRLRAVPFLPRMSRLKTRFVGTTITEYAPLPDALSAKDLVRLVLDRCAKQPLTIIKDIPLESPLLSAVENEYARELTQAAQEKGFIAVEGQALAYVPMDFKTVDEYLRMLSPGRRKDLRRKMRDGGSLEVTVTKLGDSRFKDEKLLDRYYAMFKVVYDQSDIHFDLPSRNFFRALLSGMGGEGVVVEYRADGLLAGYNVCLVYNGMLIDKYIGFDYPLARKYGLYFFSWLFNLQYALDSGLRTYVAGWTDPEVKKGLGASFTFTRHLVWIKNPALRALARPFKRFFENDRNVLEAR